MVRWGFMLGKPIERKLEEGLVDAILRAYDICNTLMKPPRPFITLQAADAVLQELYQELHPGSPWPDHVNIPHLITHSLRLVSLTQSPDPSLPEDLAVILRQPQARAVTQHLADAVLKLFGEHTFAQAAALNCASVGTKKILANSLKGKVSKAVLAELGRRRSKQVTLEEWQQLAERVRDASAGAEGGAGVVDEGVGSGAGSTNAESEESMLLAVAQVAASKSFDGVPDLAVPLEKALEIASTNLQHPLTRERLLQLLDNSLLGPRFSNLLIVMNYPDSNTQHVAINMPVVMQVVDNDYDTPDESSDHSSDGQEPDIPNILAVTQGDAGMDIILDGTSSHTSDSPDPNALGMPSSNMAPGLSMDVMELARDSLQVKDSNDNSDSTEVGVENVNDATANVSRLLGGCRDRVGDRPTPTGLNASAAVFNMVSDTRPPSELSRHLSGSEVCKTSSTTASMPSIDVSCGFSTGISNHMGNFSIDSMGSFSVGNMGGLSAEGSSLMCSSLSGVGLKTVAVGQGMVANNSLVGPGSQARGWQPQAAINIPPAMQTRYSQPWASWSQYQAAWSPQATRSQAQVHGSPSSLTWAHSQPTWQQSQEAGSQAQQIVFHSPQLGSQFAASWSRFQLGASQLNALASHSPIAPSQYQPVWAPLDTTMPLSGHARLPMVQSSLLTPAVAYRVGAAEAKHAATPCRGVLNLPDASELGPCFS